MVNARKKGNNFAYVVPSCELIVNNYLIISLWAILVVARRCFILVYLFIYKKKKKQGKVKTYEKSAIGI